MSGFFVRFAHLGVSVVMAISEMCQERMQLHEHLVEQGIAGHGEPYFFLGGENFGWGVTLQETSIAMENGPGLKMYVFPIENGGIFQPASAMLVYLVRVCFFL